VAFRRVALLPFVRRALARRGLPIHLTLFVTGRCNAKCRHCFYWEEVDAAREGLSLAEIEALGRSTGPLLWLALGGGEPTLREDLPGIARAFAPARPRVITVPTNGFLPDRTESLARALGRGCPESFVVVSVSFEGPREIHDRIRDVAGAFDRAAETVGRLRALREELPNLGVGAIFTVTAENQEIAPGFVDEIVRDLRPDNLTINLARGSPRDRSLLDVEPARYRAVVARKASAIARGDLPYFRFAAARLAVERDAEMYERIARLAEARSRGELRPLAPPGEPAPDPAAAGAVDGSGLDGAYVPCRAGDLSAVVDETGEVRPCEILSVSLGNLRSAEMDLARIWFSERAEDARRWIRDARCACTWECASATNLLFSRSTGPRLLLRALRRRGG